MIRGLVNWEHMRNHIHNPLDTCLLDNPHHMPTRHDLLLYDHNIQDYNHLVNIQEEVVTYHVMAEVAVAVENYYHKFSWMQ